MESQIQVLKNMERLTLLPHASVSVTNSFIPSSNSIVLEQQQQRESVCMRACVCGGTPCNTLIKLHHA